jgi:diacylglycerol kinase (ATP)
MRRARLIYNPTSGKEKMKRYLPYVLEKLEQAGYEVSAHRTTGADSARLAAVQAVERKYDLVIAAGGDGTIYEVINGLGEQEYRPILGIIPVGTTNDFARALKIPRDIIKAVDLICKGHSQPVDIGKANDKFFVNVAAAGAMTELTYEVPSKLKTVFGKLAYYIKGIEKLPFITHSNIKVSYEGQVYEGDVMFFFVCNTNSVGGFEHLASKSKMNDGLLDLIVVERMNIPRLVRLGIKTLSGKHLKDAKIKYLQLSEFEIEAKRDLSLNLDGEFGGKLPIRFKSLKHHFNVIVPNKTDIKNKHLI